MKNLYVGNLPHNTTGSQLRARCSKRMVKLRVNIVADKETGRSKGFAFVEMTEARDADKACVALRGHELGGRVLRVNEAKASSY